MSKGYFSGELKEVREKGSSEEVSEVRRGRLQQTTTLLHSSRRLIGRIWLKRLTVLAGAPVGRCPGCNEVHCNNDKISKNV